MKKKLLLDNSLEKIFRKEEKKKEKKEEKKKEKKEKKRKILKNFEHIGICPLLSFIYSIKKMNLKI